MAAEHLIAGAACAKRKGAARGPPLPLVIPARSAAADAHPAVMAALRMAAAAAPAPMMATAVVPAAIVTAIPAAVVAAMVAHVALRRRRRQSRCIARDRSCRGRCGTQHGGHQAGGDQECLHHLLSPRPDIGQLERYARGTTPLLNTPSWCGSALRNGKPRPNALNAGRIAQKRRAGPWRADALRSAAPGARSHGSRTPGPRAASAHARPNSRPWSRNRDRA